MNAQVGDRLDCVVREVDPEKHRFGVSLQDADKELAENRVPLEELGEGDVLDGIIDHTNPYGIWVNVGAEVIGRLNVPRRFTQDLIPGQCIRDVVIQRVDLKENKLGLTLKQPETLLGETVMISDLLRSKPSQSQSRAREVPRQPAVREAAQPRRDGYNREPHQREAQGYKREAPPVRQEVTKLRVGQFADGSVVEVSSKVVLVDIGLGHLAALAVPAAIRSQLEKGDEIQGMRVERVDWDEERQKGAVVLSLDDPELSTSSPRSEWTWQSWSWDGWQKGWYEDRGWWR